MAQELKKISIFQGLQAEQLRKIEEICQKKEYTAGTVIFEENATSPGLFIVLAGAVKVAKKMEGSQVDETLSLVNEGKFFGELSFMDGRPHSASTVAVRDTQILVIRKEDFDRLAAADPRLACEVTQHIVSEIIQVLRSMDEKFIEMMKFVWDRSN